MAITKTQTLSVPLAITQVAANGQATSSEIDLTDVDLCVLEMFHAPGSTTTPTKGTEYRVEVSATSTGDDGWVPYTSFVTDLNAAVAYAIDAVEPIGETVIAESATAGLAVDQYVFIIRASLANSEWRRIVALTTNTSFTVGDGLTTATAIGEVYYNQGQKFQTFVSGGWRRVRIKVNNNWQAGTVGIVYAQVRAIVSKWR